MSACQTVFMFSGQGSHYFQMGRALFDKNDTFRHWMARLDGIVRELSGNSIIEALYSGERKGDVFDRTILTHPAIFCVEYSLARSLIAAGVMPEIVLGASLGSFAAAAVAGFLDVEDALRAVVGQAAALEKSCEPGAMLAVLADPRQFEDEFFQGKSELAAVNFSSHFVISAKRTHLPEIEAALRKRNINYQRLPVSFAFHSQWIDQAKEPFETLMQSIRLKKGQLPLVCCDHAAILSSLPERYFWHVVRHPIRFWQATARLEQDGAYRYIDVGPAGTLATFLKYGLLATSRSTVHPILTPYCQDDKNLNRVLGIERK